MFYLYAAGLIILFVIIVYCLINVHKFNTALTKSIRHLLWTCMIIVASMFVFLLSRNRFVGNMAYSIFTATIIWMLLFFVHFTLDFTEQRKLPFTVRALAYIAIILDNVSILSNIFFNNLFRVENSVFVGNELVFVVTGHTFLYTLHLLLSYVLSIYIVFLLISKLYNTVSIYRKKYYVILEWFAIIVVLDGVFIALHMKLNFSIILYSILALAVYYYALIAKPNDLINNLIRLAANNNNDGFVCFDSDGHCIFCNERAWEIIDIDHDYKLLDSYYEKVIVKDKMHTCEYNKFTKTFEMNGEDRFIEIENYNLHDKKQNFLGAYLNLSDVTDSVIMHQHEVDVEREANQAKSDFLSRISHEIRTPVNSIYGMNEMILRESTQENVRQYAVDIRNSSDLLISIINDVLDLSKIETNKMSIIENEYSTRDLLNNIINMISARADVKELRFEYNIDESLPSRLFGDDIRIQQVLLNLLSNAVKYTHEGTVTLTINWERKVNTAIIHVDVSDTGIGIREEDIPNLFTKFMRADEVKNHGILGTGLGLSITHMLLNLMNSDLNVTSTYGTGSSFSFTIHQPIVNDTPIGNIKKHSEPATSDYSALFTAPNAKILLVDDNAINRKVFRYLLSQTRVQITDVDSGSKCLQEVCKCHYDIIFLDHMMPEMDGIETFNAMKELEDNLCVSTPVIMLTANAMSGAKENYINMGFSDFLSKPIIPNVLEAMVKKYLPNTNTD